MDQTVAIMQLLQAAVVTGVAFGAAAWKVFRFFFPKKG